MYSRLTCIFKKKVRIRGVQDRAREDGDDVSYRLDNNPGQPQVKTSDLEEFVLPGSHLLPRELIHSGWVAVYSHLSISRLCGR